MHTKSNNKTASHWPTTALQILESAANIIAEKLNHQDVYTNPQSTKDFLLYKLGGYEREVFGVMLLNSQHQLIEFRELFFGTIDAAAVIFAHNHPSGEPEPSQADKQITKKLTDALALIDVRVLDHIVVGTTPISFAERGLL